MFCDYYEKIFLCVYVSVVSLDAGSVQTDRRVEKNLNDELFGAARAGDLERVQSLVDKNVSLFAVDKRYILTAVPWAALEGKLECFDYLLARAALVK